MAVLRDTRVLRLRAKLPTKVYAIHFDEHTLHPWDEERSVDSVANGIGRLAGQREEN